MLNFDKTPILILICLVGNFIVKVYLYRKRGFNCIIIYFKYTMVIFYYISKKYPIKITGNIIVISINICYVFQNI